MTFGPWKLMDVWRVPEGGPPCLVCGEEITYGDVVIIDPETETVTHRRPCTEVVVAAVENPGDDT